MGRRTGAAILVAALMMSSVAHADVLEVVEDGSVRLRTGGGDVQWIGGPEDSGAADLPAVPDAAVTVLEPAETPAAFSASVAAAAEQAGVSPHLLAAVVWRESRWLPDAVSPKGAMGLTQLMPGTARDMAVDPRDAAANLVGGARYLRRMIDLFDGDLERALAAYNAGPGRVRRAGGVPAITETRAYVAAVIDRTGQTRSVAGVEP